MTLDQIWAERVQGKTLADLADVALLYIALPSFKESEGYDRADMELPGDQVKLIEQVAAVNPHTVVVLNVGSPVNMKWLDKVAAVVLFDETHAAEAMPPVNASASFKHPFPRASMTRLTIPGIISQP